MTISQAELDTLKRLSRYGSAERRCRAISDYVLSHQKELNGASPEMQAALLTGIADNYHKNPMNSLKGKVMDSTTVLYDLLSPVTNTQSEIARLEQNPETIVAIQDHFEKVIGRLTIDNAPRQLNAFNASIAKVLNLPKLPRLVVKDIDHSDKKSFDEHDGHDHPKKPQTPKLVTLGTYAAKSNAVEINAHAYFDNNGKFKQYLAANLQNTIIHEFTHAYNAKLLKKDVAPLFAHYTGRNGQQHAKLNNAQLLRQVLAAAEKLPYDDKKHYAYYRKNADEARAFELGDKWHEIVKKSRIKIAQKQLATTIAYQKSYLNNPLPAKIELPVAMLQNNTDHTTIKLTAQRLLDLAGTAEYAMTAGANGQANTRGVDYFWQKSLHDVMREWEKEPGANHSDIIAFQKTLTQLGKNYAGNPTMDAEKNGVQAITEFLKNNPGAANIIMKHSPAMAALDDVRKAERAVSGFFQYLNGEASPQLRNNDDKHVFADMAFNMRHSLPLIKAYQKACDAAMNQPGATAADTQKIGIEAVRQAIRKMDAGSGTTEAIFETYFSGKKDLKKDATPEERHQVWHAARTAGLEKADIYHRAHANQSLKPVQRFALQSGTHTVPVLQGSPDKTQLTALQTVQHLTENSHFGAGRKSEIQPEPAPAMVAKADLKELFTEEAAWQKPAARANYSFSV